MINYKSYINALRKCAEEHKHDTTPFAHIIVSDLCCDVADLLESLEQDSKTGRWIHFASDDECSECGWSTGKYISPSKYCPNCGAKMVGGSEKE